MAVFHNLNDGDKISTVPNLTMALLKVGVDDPVARGAWLRHGLNRKKRDVIALKHLDHLMAGFSTYPRSCAQQHMGSSTCVDYEI